MATGRCGQNLGREFGHTWAAWHQTRDPDLRFSTIWAPQGSNSAPNDPRCGQIGAAKLATPGVAGTLQARRRFPAVPKSFKDQELKTRPRPDYRAPRTEYELGPGPSHTIRENWHTISQRAPIQLGTFSIQSRISLSKLSRDKAKAPPSAAPWLYPLTIWTGKSLIVC